jgi:hypothetical protein
LRDHPQISAFGRTGVPGDEGQYLQTVFPPDTARGGPGQFGFDPAAHLTEGSPLVSDAHRDQLLWQWGMHWDAGKPVRVEKSSANLIRMRFLLAMFPSASFIVLLRHPVATAYATQQWSRATVGTLLHHWVACHELFASDRRWLPRLLLLRYEDLVAEPVATLARAFGFLHLEPVPLRRAIEQNTNEPYYQRWEADDRREIEERFEVRVNAFGYSLLRLRGR